MPTFSLRSPLPHVASLCATIAAAAIWSTTGQAQVASNFSVVSDTAATGYYGYGAYPAINDNGIVAFYAEATPGVGAVYTATPGATPALIATGGNGMPSLNQSGTIAAVHSVQDGSYDLLYKHQTDGTSQEVARTGIDYRSFPGFPFIGNNGAVVFYANCLPVSPNRWGLFVGNGDGSTTLLADNLGIFSTFGNSPSMNTPGTIAFTASKDDTEAGLYIAKGGTATGITTVITQAASPVYKMDGAPFINDSGQIVFKANEDSTSEPGIFMVQEDGTNLQTIARAGASAPYSQFSSPVINNAGTIVFHAWLDSGGRGIFAGPDPARDKVIAVGDALFGSTVSNLGYTRGLNNLNEIAFYYQLENGQSGIAKAKVTPRLAGPSPTPTPLPTATPPTSYHLTDLGVLPAQLNSAPGSLNAKGQVSGTSGSFAFRRMAAALQNLGTLPGGRTSRAFGINGSGQVVGDSSFTGSGDLRHATLWTSGKKRDLGTLPAWGNYSRANAINSAGHVVGVTGSQLDGTNTRAFIWGPAKGMRDMGTLGGLTSTATAINDSAVATGYSQTGTGTNSQHAYVWTAAAGMRDIGTIAGPASFGTAINAKGVVVGHSTINDTDNREHAFLYDGATMHDLGAIGAGAFASDRSYAYGINNNDHVVGSTYRKYTGGALVQIAFAYRNGKMVNVAKLLDGSGAGYHLLSANAINDNEQILAVAQTANGSRAVLLTPNP